MLFFKNSTFKGLWVLCIIFIVSACSHHGTQQIVKVTPERDPLEGLNRAIFAFNMQFDTLLAKPTAGLYRGIFPQEVRHSVQNFFQNLREPNNFANALLKGEFNQAGRCLARFTLNSTFGIGGLFDVGSHLKMPYKRHDFGLTLASWGIQDGPYLMIPLRGPSTFRDSLGRVVDFMMDPLNIYLWVKQNHSNHHDHSTKHYTYWSYAREMAEGIDERSNYIEALDELKRGSLDFYLTARSAYFQNRDAWAKSSSQSGLSSTTSVYDDLWKEDKAERQHIKPH